MTLELLSQYEVELSATTLPATAIVDLVETVGPVDTHQSDHWQIESYTEASRAFHVEGIEIACLSPSITTFEEAQYLLKYAGHAPLYVRRKRDVVIWFGFMKGQDLDTVNATLIERGMQPLIRN